MPDAPSTAPFLWTNTPRTDEMLRQSAVAPLPDPAASVAERLVMLAHRHLNPVEWSSRRADRFTRYWGALQENVQAAADAPDCAIWWEEMTNYMLLRPTLDAYLTEKEVLTHPTQLDPPVAERAVLHHLSRYPTELVDRTRIWLTTRGEDKTFLEGQL